jgi:hypothetical protein
MGSTSSSSSVSSSDPSYELQAQFNDPTSALMSGGGLVSKYADTTFGVVSVPNAMTDPSIAAKELAAINLIKNKNNNNPSSPTTPNSSNGSSDSMNLIIIIAAAAGGALVLLLVVYVAYRKKCCCASSPNETQEGIDDRQMYHTQHTNTTAVAIEGRININTMNKNKNSNLDNINNNVVYAKYSPQLELQPHSYVTVAAMQPISNGQMDSSQIGRKNFNYVSKGNNISRTNNGVGYINAEERHAGPL